MSVEQQFLKEKGIQPRISFKQTPEVKGLKLLKRKADSFEKDGEKFNGIKYLVQHEGNIKTFFTSSIGLISDLMNYDNGEVVDITLKFVKGDNGNFRSRYYVKRSKDTYESNEIPEDIKEEGGKSVEKIEEEMSDDGDINDNLPF